MIGLGSVPTEEVQISNARFSDKFEFSLTITRKGNWRFYSTMSDQTLSRLANKARELPLECRRSNAEYRSQPIEKRDERMKQALGRGSALFAAMIPDASKRKEFAEILSAHAGTTIRVTGDGVCIPWEALCLAEDPDKATYEDFLGWNHVVSREVLRAYQANKLTATVAIAGFVEDDSLACVISGNSKLAVDQLGATIAKFPLVALRQELDRKHFYEFFYDKDRPKDLVQFDCHIEGSDTVQSSHMRVTDKFKLPFNIFNDAILLTEPFVLLNACHGGTTNWASADGYAAKLRTNGAALVIAAEASLGDAFMTDFASLFYLMSNQSANAAEALLKARRITLADVRNPAGLFYGIYGEPELKLEAPPPSPATQAALIEAASILAKFWPPVPTQYRKKRP